MFEKEINRLTSSNKNSSLVIFVGSGVSLNSKLPKWKDIIVNMYESLYGKRLNSDYKFSSDEYLTIPQKVYDLDEENYKEIFLKAFDGIQEIPNKLDDLIVSLKPDHIITTNYDHLLEKSLVKKGLGSKYGVVYDDSSFIEKAQNYYHYLIKMHGDLDCFESMVLKENDYLNYENKRPFTSNFINTLLSTHVFLFVGYSMSDYNFKIILNRTNDFRSKMKSARLYNSVWVSEVEKNYDIEEAYFKKNNVDIVNLNYLDSNKSKADKLFSFLKELSSQENKEKIYNDKESYEKLRYVSHFEIDSVSENVESLGGVRLYRNNQFISTFKMDNELTNLFKKTSNYIAINKDTGEKIEVGTKEKDTDVYNKIISGTYNEINYEKGDLSLIDKQYLYNLFGLSENLNRLETESNYNLDKFNDIIIDHNFEMINSNYKLINADRYLNGYYIFKIIDGNVMDVAKYNSILDRQRSKYDLSNKDFYLEFKNDEYNLEDFGNLASVKEISDDLFKYEIINRLILNDSSNAMVFKLLFQCILCTYNHNINTEKTEVDVKSNYNISLIDFVIIVNKLKISDIKDMIKKYNIDQLRFSDIEKIVSYFHNLCNSYISRSPEWSSQFVNRITDMISKSLFLISFSNDISSSQMLSIAEDMYDITLKTNVTKGMEMYSIFSNTFINKIINDKNSFSIYENLFINILKNRTSFLTFFGDGFENLRLESFLRTVVIEKYSFFSNIGINELISFDNIIYSCIFIPVIIDNGEDIKRLFNYKDNTTIVVIAYLMTEKEISTQFINVAFKKMIQTIFTHNKISLNVDNMLIILLRLKSLGAKVPLNEIDKSYRDDHFRLNRLIGFLEDDLGFDYSDVDILDYIWIAAVIFDRENNYFIINKLSNHKSELLNDNLKYKLKHGLLDENEMLVLMLIGFTAQELINI
ncbi:hypothetical protein AKUA1202_01150 [Apilactobacillus kunkeei]|nr:hypothetical protein AKUA1202_01150 [Apilactobacillus kunkeei]